MGNNGSGRARNAFSGQWLNLRLFLPVAALVCTCAAPLKQFYPDTFYPEDQIYENKPLRFILKYEGNWVLFTDPRDMDNGGRALAREFAKKGVELLFMGATAEGMHGTRGIAAHYNEPAMDHATRIRELNKNDLQNDRGLLPFLAGRNSMVKWMYDRGDFRFVEFFFTIATYDIRIAFWSRKDLFDKFLPVYEGIISSLEINGGL